MIAWHAGKSSHNGRNNLNRISLGVEWLVEDAPDLPTLKAKVNDQNNPPYTDAQYVSGAELYAALMNAKDIPLTGHLMHSQVSGKDVRPDPKFDPGKAFDFQRLNSMIQSKLKPSLL